MPMRAILVLVLALVVGALVFFITPRLIATPTPIAAPAPVQPAGLQVLVAARDLPAGTPLKAEDTRWQVWPEAGLPAAALVRERNPDINQVFGGTVLRGLVAGEPITTARVAPPGEGRILAATLAPGMRAVTIKIDQVSGAAGFVTPGSIVDVIMTERFEKDENPAAQVQNRVKQVSGTVLAGVKVLAIDQTLSDLNAAPKVGATATLELSPKDAERLLLASRMGQLSLVLRSLTDEAIAAHQNALPGVTHDTEVSRFLSEIEKRPAPRPSTGAPAQASVTIWRPQVERESK